MITDLNPHKTALLVIDIQRANLEDMERAGAEVVYDWRNVNG